MKKTNAKKKLLPAIGMLAISAAMLSSATFAWFTMNKDVTVTGMKLKAQATDGIVISGDNKATWKTDWDVAMTSGVALYPTSTDGDAATPAWAVAYSREFDDAYKNQNQSDAAGYTDLTMSFSNTALSSDGDTFAATEGIGTAGSPTRNYVLLKNFYIKSTGEDDWAQQLVIDEVTATTTTSASADLNKSLRVLVTVNDTDSFIYAPVANYDTACKFKGTGSNLTLIASTTNSDTSVVSIPNTDANAVNVKMYMYFEGEDENCKSSNVTDISVDTLTVSAKFTTQDPPSGP